MSSPSLDLRPRGRRPSVQAEAWLPLLLLPDSLCVCVLWGQCRQLVHGLSEPSPTPGLASALPSVPASVWAYQGSSGKWASCQRDDWVGLVLMRMGPIPGALSGGTAQDQERRSLWEQEWGEGQAGKQELFFPTPKSSHVSCKGQGRLVTAAGMNGSALRVC